MGKDRDVLVREYHAWSETAAEVRRDLDRIGEHRVVGYNVDYSVLFPYLWSPSALGQPSNQPKWDAVCKSVCLELLKYELPSRTRFVLTSVSFVEAVEYIHRHLQRQTTVHSKWDNRFSEFRSEVDNMEEALLNSLTDDRATRRGLEERLDGLSRKFGLDAPLALNRLRKFVAPGGPLVGIRDVVSKLELGDYVQRFTDLYEEMEKTRGQAFTEKRSPDERRFHYMVDCANLVVCEAISDADNNTEMGFLTRASNKRFIVKEYGRTSLMVLMMLRLHRSTEFKDPESRQLFLQSMGTEARQIVELLKQQVGFDEEQEGFLGETIQSFESRYITRILGSLDEPTGSIEQRVAALKIAASSRERAQESLVASIESVSKGLKRIVDEHSGFLDDELMTTFKINEEPRAREILRP